MSLQVCTEGEIKIDMYKAEGNTKQRMYNMLRQYKRWKEQPETLLEGAIYTQPDIFGIRRRRKLVVQNPDVYEYLYTYYKNKPSIIELIKENSQKLKDTIIIYEGQISGGGEIENPEKNNKRKKLENKTQTQEKRKKRKTQLPENSKKRKEEYEPEINTNEIPNAKRYKRAPFGAPPPREQSSLKTSGVNRTKLN